MGILGKINRFTDEGYKSRINMTIKYLTNKRGDKTAVVIPIKDWLAYKEEHEKLIKTNEKHGGRKKIRRKGKLDSVLVRNFASDSNAFAFWENNDEDLYQDYLNSK
jgi:intein/homing endonuclease